MNVNFFRFECELFQIWMWTFWGLNVNFLKNECELFEIWMWTFWGLNVNFLRFECELFEVWMWTFWDLNVNFLRFECELFEIWMWTFLLENVEYPLYQCEYELFMADNLTWIWTYLSLNVNFLNVNVNFLNVNMNFECLQSVYPLFFSFGWYSADRKKCTSTLSSSGPDQFQVISRCLRGPLQFKFKSQIQKVWTWDDTIIARYHHHPENFSEHSRTFWNILEHSRSFSDQLLRSPKLSSSQDHVQDDCRTF